MAECKPTMLLKDTDKSLQCCICFAVFDQPKQLSCFHTFCLKCLKKYWEEGIDGDMKPCPLCRTKYYITEGDIEKLPDNQFIIRLLLMKINKEKEKQCKCDLCAAIEVNSEAEGFCKECKQCLCPHCKKLHSVAATSKFHSVVGLDERPSNDELLRMQPSYCETHSGKEIEYYCCDCNILLCSKCHYDIHKVHVTKLVTEFANAKREVFTEDESKVQKAHEEGCDQLRKLEQEKERTFLAASETTKTIEGTFDNFIKLVISRKMQLLCEVEEMKTNRLKEIESQEDLDQLHVTELESFLSCSRMVMERGTDCEIIRVADELHKRAEELIKSQDERNKQELPDCCIKSIPSPGPTADEVETLIGVVINADKGTLPQDQTPASSYFRSRPSSCPNNTTTAVVGNFSSNSASAPTSEPPDTPARHVSHTVPSLTKIIKLPGGIKSVAALNDHMFVLTDKLSLHVYNWNTGTTKSNISIPGMKSSEGVAVSFHPRALYISDGVLDCIHRVNLVDNNAKRWGLKKNYEPSGLSVTAENNLLVTVQIRDTEREIRVLEYSSEGKLIREIKTNRSIKEAWQTVQPSSDQFIICHGHESSLHRLCVINSEGYILKHYGGNKGRREGELDSPLSVAVDYNRGHVFVADNANNRVLMFNRDLTIQGQVQISQDISKPSSLYFDSSSNRLFVGEWCTGRQEDGRVLIIYSPDKCLRKI